MMQSTSKKVLLLSIKPEFANKIFEGLKRVELRRIRPNVTAGDKVLVYISSPVKALAGEFIVDQLIEAPIDDLWSLVEGKAGISREQFNNYYDGTDIGYAIFFADITKLDIPVNLERLQKIWEGFRPPQSYMYITQEKLNTVKSLHCTF